MSSDAAAAPSELDIFDLRILAVLQEDATTPLDEVAERVGLSRTPCWRRIQRLERDGVIRGRVILIDPASVGLKLTALVFVQAPRHAPDWMRRFTQIAEDAPEIVEAYRLAGEIDYLLRVVVADMKPFDDFYHRLSQSIDMRSVTTRVVLESLKAPGRLPIPRDKR